MKVAWTFMLVLVAVTALARSVAMLPPEVFKDPIFAAAHEGDSSDGEYTEFA